MGSRKTDKMKPTAARQYEHDHSLHPTTKQSSMAMLTSSHRNPCSIRPDKAICIQTWARRVGGGWRGGGV